MRVEVWLEEIDEERYEAICPFCRRRTILEREVIRRTPIWRIPYEEVEEVEWRALDYCKHFADIDPLKKAAIFER